MGKGWECVIKKPAIPDTGSFLIFSLCRWGKVQVRADRCNTTYYLHGSFVITSKTFLPFLPTQKVFSITMADEMNDWFTGADRW